MWTRLDTEPERRRRRRRREKGVQEPEPTDTDHQPSSHTRREKQAEDKEPLILDLIWDVFLLFQTGISALNREDFLFAPARVRKSVVLQNKMKRERGEGLPLGRQVSGSPLIGRTRSRTRGWTPRCARPPEHQQPTGLHPLDRSPAHTFKPSHSRNNSSGSSKHSKQSRHWEVMDDMQHVDLSGSAAGSSWT
ncbi:hypothetical protein WMY93_003356 [Mugilogobius chulae]|uniref:Uncharacterized protein n=1 Tax=Mugilogobius chulae TaxID=88201 RepID=A0AAW0PX87_9GOBI